MSTRLTLFKATLTQDSALSVSGLDRESSAAQPFAIVGGVPTLVGRGLKGAAVAMAKRFFEPLPRAITDDGGNHNGRNGALRRSAWEFSDATTTADPRVRAGVGIRHQTGARVSGVLYDREVIPAGTVWEIRFRVDWSHVVNEDEGREAEGILGFVLAQQWAQGRCWLGGGAARGLGWCHLHNVKAWRLDGESYETWVASGRTQLPRALAAVPMVEPTRSWCFRTLDVDIAFGAYQPEPDEAPWGLDMLAIGTHYTESTVQPTGDGSWAKPAWASNTTTPDALGTNRAMLMDGSRPLLPGASVRGPIRHAFSRAERAAGGEVDDPHLAQDNVREGDAGRCAFGTVSQSSHILIRDARAEAGWSAAKLHMHAEDEFSAGSYGSSKRDAVRLLSGTFPVRILIEGATPGEVEKLVEVIDRQVALGALGHLPVGGHKTRGAGWGRWLPKPWAVDDVTARRTWTPPPPEPVRPPPATSLFFDRSADAKAWVRTNHGALDATALSLEEAAAAAKVALGSHALVAWWCDPTIDLDVTTPPATFGRGWPESRSLQVDEVAFYAERAVWRAARTSRGARYLLIEEVASNENGAKQSAVIHTPAQLHDDQRRFESAKLGGGNVLVREWHVGDEVLGFTLTMDQR